MGTWLAGAFIGVVVGAFYVGTKMQNKAYDEECRHSNAINDLYDAKHGLELDLKVAQNKIDELERELRKARGEAEWL